jgi:hypothetical protein
MSESRQRTSPKNRLEGIASRLALRRRRTGDGWFGVSVFLHALAFAALLYLTPVREIVKELRQPSRPEQNMSAAELARLADAIELHAGEQIEANTGELARVFDQMGGIQEGISMRFAAFDRQRRADAASDALDEMKKAADQMREAVTSIEQDVPAESTDRFQATAEDAHQQAKALHDQHTTQKARVAQLERTLTTQQNRAGQQEQQVEKLKDAGRNEKQIEPAVKRLEEQQAAVQQAEQQLEAGRAEQDRLRAAAEDSQKLALKAQEDVADALRKIVEARAAQPQTGAPAASAPLTASRPTSSPPRTGGGTPDVADLYAQARSLEDDIAERFKEVRAMDLAMVRDMPLEQARGDIDLIRPVRPDLDVALLRDAARTDARFEEHKEEVRTALRETSSMVNLSHRMLEMASESVDKMKFGTDVQVASAEEEAPDFRLIIRELAMEDVSGRFSDMADAMRALEQQGNEGAGNGGGADGSAGEPGGGGGRPGVDFKDLTAEELAAMGSLPLFGADGQGEDAALMPKLAPDVPAVGARKLNPDGRPGPWMYIDTWYTVGPFPNPNRSNIDREFPPDSLIDLDASYVGKDGRTIRWEFAQSDGPEVSPPNAEPYGIWYAYTEFYCDKPRDVLIALGSDDRGNLKINGIPVWLSSKQLKGWSIDEVWRRVHFNQGVNRLLYRVENGWQVTGFSLMLRLDDAAPTSG